MYSSIHLSKEYVKILKQYIHVVCVEFLTHINKNLSFYWFKKNKMNEDILNLFYLVISCFRFTGLHSQDFPQRISASQGPGLSNSKDLCGLGVERLLHDSPIFSTWEELSHILNLPFTWRNSPEINKTYLNSVKKKERSARFLRQTGQGVQIWAPGSKLNLINDK